MKARPLIALALCLLAGLAIQTLVAWTLFIRGDYAGGTGVLHDPPLKPGERTTTGFVVPADWASRTRVEWWGIGKTRETVSEAMWLGSRLGFTEGDGRQATFNGFSAGWPMRSFWGCDFLSQGVNTDVPAPLVAVPAWVKAGGYKVPIEPRWSGLIVNTLLFALPLFAVAWGVERRHASRRRRLGLCLRCGYPLKGLAKCPECGIAPATAKEGA